MLNQLTVDTRTHHNNHRSYKKNMEEEIVCNLWWIKDHLLIKAHSNNKEKSITIGLEFLKMKDGPVPIFYKNRIFLLQISGFDKIIYALRLMVFFCRIGILVIFSIKKLRNQETQESIHH